MSGNMEMTSMDLEKNGKTTTTMGDLISQYPEQRLWGEFPSEKCNARLDYSEIIKYSKNPHKLNEYESLLPAFYKRENSAQNIINLPHMESQILQTIALQQHTWRINEMIKKKSSNYRGKTLGSLPIPVPSEMQSRCKNLRNQFGFLHKESSNFTRGIGTEPPIIDNSIKGYILTQCIATLFAQIGFETSSKSVLEVLRDVLDEFLTNFCRILRRSTDTSFLNYNDGFPDEVERVLTETGIGGMRALHEYYLNRVVNYQKLVLNRCQQIMREQEEIDKEDVPEFHLSGGEDDSELRLQSELQMLDYLEQNVEFSTLQNGFGNVSNPSVDYDMIS